MDYVLQRHLDEVVSTNYVVQQRDGQTDRQTKKLNVFASPGGARSPSPTKLGMVIEDLEHVLAPLKRFVIRRIVLPLGGAENWGNPDPLKFKPP